MKKILFSVMRNKVINLIKILGFGVNELIVEIPLSIGNFDTIEWIPEDNTVILHLFEKEDYDIVIDFEDLSEDDQLKVYQVLSIIYN
jgi:hypothetical protein